MSTAETFQNADGCWSIQDQSTIIEGRTSIQQSSEQCASTCVRQYSPCSPDTAQTPLIRTLPASNAMAVGAANAGTVPVRESAEPTSCLKECQQVCVELIFVGVCDTVRGARIDLQRCAPDQLR